MKLNTAQRIRLNKVLDYLKEQGVTQKSFAKDYFEDDETRISELKSGKRTTIPDGFLDMLQAQYHINADYIRGNSKMMLDVCGTKLENFDKVFESWKTVEKRKRIEKDGLKINCITRFLHVKMDKNFYEFLLNVNEARLETASDTASLENRIEELKKKYTTKENIEEYVILPKNALFEYISDEIDNRKQLDEILDLSMMQDISDE